MTTAWNLIPLDAKLAILPFLLFVLLVESGQDLSLMLCKSLIPEERCVYPGLSAKPTVADIYALILTAHLMFTLVLTYYVNMLKGKRLAANTQAREQPIKHGQTDTIDIAGEVVTYAAAFLSIAKLFTVSIQTERVEFLALFLLYKIFTVNVNGSTQSKVCSGRYA